MITLLLTSALQAAVWYFILRGVRRRAWAEGWNTAHKWHSKAWNRHFEQHHSK